jgi:hypothetical protein
MGTAFLSEHTAEYVLVPSIVSILSRQFTKVIPLYFWSTREGSKVSRGCDLSQPMRLINVFARRPKVETPHQPTMEVKFNSTLFDAASHSIDAGIPVFAGVPLVSSLMKFNLDTHCAWFSISGADSPDVYYQLTLEGEVDWKSDQCSAVTGPLHENEIIEVTLEYSREMFWSEAIENLRLIRRVARQADGYRSMFGGGYHPFSVLLFDDDPGNPRLKIR